MAKKSLSICILCMVILAFNVNADLASWSSDLVKSTDLLSLQSPRVLTYNINPHKVWPGDNLQITIEVLDKYGVKSAVAEFHHEKGIDSIEMTRLYKGDDNRETYQVNWISHDTLPYTWYSTRVTLINNNNKKSIIDIPWEDPTINHPAEHITAGTFDAGDFTFQDNVDIRGALEVHSGEDIIIDVSTSNSTTNTAAIYADATSRSGNAHGVMGTGSSFTGSDGAVFGKATSSTGTTYGIYAWGASSSAIGAVGNATAATSTETYGVTGTAYSSTGVGIYGIADSNTGPTIGVYGETPSKGTGSAGVQGYNGLGTGYAVHGKTYSPSGWPGYFKGGKGLFVSNTIKIGNSSKQAFYSGNCVRIWGSSPQTCPSGKTATAGGCDCGSGRHCHEYWRTDSSTYWASCEGSGDNLAVICCGGT